MGPFFLFKVLLEIADKTSMKLSQSYGVPFRQRTYSPNLSESLETKKVRALGNRIQEIQRETQYIKENGQKPPSNPFGGSYWMKKLDSF